MIGSLLRGSLLLLGMHAYNPDRQLQTNSAIEQNAANLQRIQKAKQEAMRSIRNKKNATDKVSNNDWMEQAREAEANKRMAQKQSRKAATDEQSEYKKLMQEAAEAEAKELKILQKEQAEFEAAEKLANEGVVCTMQICRPGFTKNMTTCQCEKDENVCIARSCPLGQRFNMDECNCVDAPNFCAKVRCSTGSYCDAEARKCVRGSSPCQKTCDTTQTLNKTSCTCERDVTPTGCNKMMCPYGQSKNYTTCECQVVYSFCATARCMSGFTCDDIKKQCIPKDTTGRDKVRQYMLFKRRVNWKTAEKNC